MDESLAETELCDWSSEGISELVEDLKNKSKDEREYAVNAFYWVRDNIYYFFIKTSKASDVLKDRRGDCFGKSNLLVALLRANGIPARFQFQLLKGDALSDVIKLKMGDKSYFKNFHITHALANVKFDDKWIRADCTRDKYLSPDRANEWDGKTDTIQHPFLIKDLGYDYDVKDYKERSQPKKFVNFVEIYRILINTFIEEERYKNAGIRSFGDEETRKMRRDIYDRMVDAMRTNNRGDARVFLWLTKRFFAEQFGLDIKVLERSAKNVKYSCSCCVSDDAYEYIGPYLHCLDQGMAHGINPEMEFRCNRTKDGIGDVEIINKDKGGYYRPILEILGRGLKNLLKR